jgi:hypothetical protein
LPRVRNPLLYDIAIIMFINDEAQLWNRLSLCWTWGWTTLAWTFVWSLSWVENSNYKKILSFWFLCYIFLYGIFSFLAFFSSSPF